MTREPALKGAGFALSEVFDLKRLIAEVSKTRWSRRGFKLLHEKFFGAIGPLLYAGGACLTSFSSMRPECSQILRSHLLAIA
jgi:hypothetical protein